MIDETTLGLRAHPAFGAPSPLPKAEFSTLYAFGDSLSDAGNDFILTDGVLPTAFVYSDGRFSNGAVWVQDLAKKLGLGAVKPSLAGGKDFAYGGAETGQDPLHDVLPIDLPSQLVQFLADDPHPLAGALYTLSIGANDVLDAIPEYATNPNLAVQDVQTAVGNEISFVASLAAIGAQNFLIMNVPDLGVTPEEAGDKATATYLSQLYDADLASSLTALGAMDHISIHLLDAFTLIDEGVADPAKYHLKNVTTPVWTGNYEDPLSGTFNAFGKAQNSYLFFDQLHPTAHGHAILADAAIKLL
jgi:phospholipase/lecithinase/hemolysin